MEPPLEPKSSNPHKTTQPVARALAEVSEQHRGRMLATEQLNEFALRNSRERVSPGLGLNAGKQNPRTSLELKDIYSSSRQYFFYTPSRPVIRRSTIVHRIIQKGRGIRITVSKPWCISRNTSTVSVVASSRSPWASYACFLVLSSVAKEHYWSSDPRWLTNAHNTIPFSESVTVFWPTFRAVTLWLMSVLKFYIHQMSFKWMAPYMYDG